MLFPQKLRILRNESGLTQKDIAKKIGVDIPMYSRYEHGTRRPKREQVVKLARIFKVDANELVALWLADSALNEIGSDKLAEKALEYLRQELGGGTPAPEPEKVIVEVPVEVPARKAYTVDVPLADASLRHIVQNLGDSPIPMYMDGDALSFLGITESDSIDCIVTAPPYWGLRRYGTESIGTDKIDEFIAQLVAVMGQLYRVLKPSGSLWLNMADAYSLKSLQAIPWRVVLPMLDEQGWILRNDVIWDKQAGAFDSSQDHLRNTHEYLFHFVKSDDFYYNDEELRVFYNNLSSKKAKEGRTSSGVTGSKYRKNITSSSALSAEEKENALKELDKVVAMVNGGEIPDFRMFLRENEGEVLTSRSEKAKSINEKGYYFLLYNPNGTMPADIWEIAPANSPVERYNIFPESLCRLIILATCPHNGIVLDPYCGLGTTCKVAFDLHRRSIGFDINPDYIKKAKEKIQQQPLSLF